MIWDITNKSLFLQERHVNELVQQQLEKIYTFIGENN